MRKALKLGALSAGFLLVGAPAEAAPADMFSSLNIGIGNGNQVGAIVQAPVNVCGNAIALLGSANAGCHGGSSATISGGHSQVTDPIWTMDHRRDRRAPQRRDRQGNDHGRCDVNLTSVGNVGILNGNQVYLPVQIPVDVSGNAIGILGNAGAWSMGGASATYC